MSRQSYMQTQAARRSRESGTVLVLFALLMVGVFGLLGAVVVGLGLRRWARRRAKSLYNLRMHELHQVTTIR